MRRTVLLVLDVSLLCAATIFAFVLRENLEVGLSRSLEFVPYLAATAIASWGAFTVSGVHRAVWQFSSGSDYMRVMTAVAAAVVGAVALSFAWNRLEGTPRSLPFIQLIFGVAFLIGARAIRKLTYDAQQHRRAFGAFLQPTAAAPPITLLVVGISKLTETYLHAVAELAPGRIRIAGLVGTSNRHVGRLVASHSVLGETSDLESILDDLEIHGVTIDRIVVTSSFQSFRIEDREALLRIERSRSIPLQFLVQDLGFDFKTGGDSISKSGEMRRQMRSSRSSFQDIRFSMAPETLSRISQRRYWKIKRLVDFIAAFSALVVLSPFMLAAAACMAASVGFPVLFWQQRPGLGGRPLRLYKFRTMKAAYACDGRRLSDEERVSGLGSLMRRLRFDELPQLFNVLRGDMAIIGPRPLLHWEQTDAQSARLLVRPGLTGWAQVIGGRTISSNDKAALDVWYVQNASLRLDLEILARTIAVVVFGERVSPPDIQNAWRDLGESGAVKTQTGSQTQPLGIGGLSSAQVG